MPRCLRIARCLILAGGVSFLVAGVSQAQDLQSSPGSDTAYRDQIHALAGRILKRADKAKCRPNSCTILVENFTMPSGSTSRLGMQMADSMSAELINQGKGIRTVDRSSLQDYLARERIPSNALKDREAARWLATEFQANAVLIGNVEQLGDHFNFLTELLNVSNDKVGPQEAMEIAIQEPQKAFISFEPYDELRPKATATRDTIPPPVQVGAMGAGIPRCIYCPPPQYTEAARKVKFNATVVLEVTVTEDGRADDIRVLKGVPFGLNESAIKVISSWKFRPATYEDRPIATRVPIETTFRLY